MNRTRLIVVMVGIVAVGIFAVDASAMYNPGIGGFMQRDPGADGAMPIGAGGPTTSGQFIPRDQYRDGMSLYQYVKSNPPNENDPKGLGVLTDERWDVSGTGDGRSRAKSWKYKAWFNRDKCVLTFSLKVLLNPDEDFTKKRFLEPLVPEWTKRIQEAFSGWKLIRKNKPVGPMIQAETYGCCQCQDGVAMKFKVDFVIRSWAWKADQDVDVDWLQRYDSTAHHWHLGDRRFCRAPFGGVVHEIAHMFGLFDEYVDDWYPERVIAPEGAESVMNTSATGRILQRHIQLIADDANVNMHLPCGPYMVAPE